MATRFILIFSLLASLGVEAALPRQSGKIIGTGNERPTITLTAPKGGWTVDRMVEVAGSISDSTINPITVSINGDRYLLKTFNGAFKRKFPVVRGKNSIILQGANKAGLAKAQRTLFAEVPSLAMFIVLTSDTDGVYTDLHVYEPLANAPDPIKEGEKSNVHVYWADTSSPSGGKFYLNEQGGNFDCPGFGPYLYTHASPPLGIYRIDVNYWPSGNKGHTVANLNLVLFGGTSNEIRRSVKFPLVMPGETVTLGWVRLDKSQKAYLYFPTLETKPSEEAVWPAWVLNYGKGKKTASNASSGDTEGY